MNNKYIFLKVPGHPELEVSVKMENEGVVVDIWDDEVDDCIATTYELYNELGMKVEHVTEEYLG